MDVERAKDPMVAGVETEVRFAVASKPVPRQVRTASTPPRASSATVPTTTKATTAVVRPLPAAGGVTLPGWAGAGVPNGRSGTAGVPKGGRSWTAGVPNGRFCAAGVPNGVGSAAGRAGAAAKKPRSSVTGTAPHAVDRQVSPPPSAGCRVGLSGRAAPWDRNRGPTVPKRRRTDPSAAMDRDLCPRLRPPLATSVR